MPKKAYKPAFIRESWRPDSANSEQRANRQRAAWRWLITAVLVLSFASFGYLLFGPLFHPTLRLYYLTAGSYEMMEIKPIPFFQEDAVRFLSIDGSFRKEDAVNEFTIMESPEVVQAYLQRISSFESDDSDVALLQLSAQPLLEGERPFLKCSNFNVEAPQNGSVSVEELLNQLDRMTVGLTLICLNLGPSDSQGVEDSIRDTFVYRLQDLMKERKNPKQWLLVSNSTMESSYVSMELRSSVFSYAITNALQGAADANQDAIIDLDEFTRFVVGFTQKQVQRESGGNSQQTPLLITSGANADSNLSLISIASTPRPVITKSWWSRLTSWWKADAQQDSEQESDPVAIKAQKEKAQREKTWLTEYLDRSTARIQELTVEAIEENLDILPVAIGDRVKQSIGLEEEEEAESSGTRPVTEDAIEQPPVDEQAKDSRNEIADNDSASGESDGSVKKSTANEQENKPPESAPIIGKSLPDISRLADSASSNMQLMQLAWQFCQYLELPQEKLMRPVDVAPHAWNEFTSHFHGVEERLRTDSIVDSKTIRLQLTSEIVGAYQFAMTGQARVGTLAKRVSSQMPTLAIANAACTSVGLAERLAEFGGPPLSSSLATQIKQFDIALGEETPESFDKWSQKLPVEFTSQYVEFFWAQQFAARPGTPWIVTRRTLDMWRQYELLAYDPMVSNLSIQQSLLSAQRSLLEATRLGLDQIGEDWIARCLATIEETVSDLEEASEKRNKLRGAFQLRNNTLADLQSILQWRNIAVTRLGNTLMDEDIEKALDVLHKLCVQLQDRENCELNELVRNHDNLRALTDRISGYWIDVSTELISGEPKDSASNNWVTDSLLATALNRSTHRNRLLALPISTKSPISKGVHVDVDIDPDLRIPTLSPSRLETKNSLLQIRFETLAASIAGMGMQITLDEKVQSPGSEIDHFYKSLVSQVSQSFSSIETSTPEADLMSQLLVLRRADQSLRLLPAWESQLFDGRPLESRLWQLEILQCILKKQSLTQKCLQDALPQEVPFLNDAIGRLAFLASRLSRNQATSIQATTPGLSVRGTSTISLLAEPQAPGEIVFQNVGNSINNSWVLIDYDPSVLEVTGPTGILLHPVSTLPSKADAARRQAEEQLMKALVAGETVQEGQNVIEERQRRIESLRSDLAYPIHPESCLVAPSMGLSAGQVVTIPFKVARVGAGPPQTKLIWKLVGGEDYVRHEVTIQLPEAQKLKLVVDGEANSWGPSGEGIDLFSWPNRPTNYRLGLRNESGQPRVLSAELSALMSRSEVTLPDGFLTPNASNEIVNALGPLKTVAILPEVSIDSSPETVWLALQPLASAVATTPGASSKEQVPMPADHGLVLVLTEKTTNQRYWRRIESRVRHPRSYIEPSVRFDAVSERAELRFTAKTSENFPETGIEVVGRVVEQLPRGTEMKVTGTLLAGETLVLYCQVPNSQPRELTFEIDVDGFPRAFVIKVPCWRTNLDIPVVSDFQSIELADPTQSMNIGPNEKSQKLRLKIDAVPGAFETKRDYVEVGWDLDRDREFAGEATFKLAAERQVDAAVNSILNGRISMTANVKDIELELPPPSLKNQRVNLLARMFAGGEMVWSKPIEVIADFDPPTITGVEIVPGNTFMQGTDLQIRVGVDDARLSGIASVEAKLDSHGVAKFSESAAPVQVCIRESDSSWTLTLPTAELLLGQATLYIRATDRVGNASDDSKTLLTVLSEQEWQENRKNATQELSGTVVYLNDPLPNAKVTVENDKGVVVHTMKTDERGMFKIPGVQVGRYKIVAVGVMKNRPRKAEQVIEVMGSPSPPLRLRMLAK